MDFTKDNIFSKRPTLLIDLRFPRNIARRVRRPFCTDSSKFIDSLLAARLAWLTSLQRLKPVENTRFIFVPNLFSLISRPGRGSRFEKNLDVKLPQTRFPGSADVQQSSRLLFVKSIQALSSGVSQTELAGDHTEVSSVPGSSADVSSVPAHAVPAPIRTPPSIVQPFQGLFSWALQTKPLGDHTDVPLVSKRGGRTTRREIIKNQAPLLRKKIILAYRYSCGSTKIPEESTFVKHPQMVPTGSLQTETATQFGVPPFFNSEVGSDKGTHTVVFAERVNPSHIQAAKLPSTTRPSSEIDRISRQIDSSDDVSSDIITRYSHFPAVRILHAAPAHIKKPPSFVQPFQSVFSRALPRKSKGDHVEVPPVRKRGGRTTRREIIKNQTPLLKGKTILAYPYSYSSTKIPEEPTFVKHAQMAPTGSLQTETVTQFGVPPFFNSEVDSDKDMHTVVFAQRVNPSHIQAAKLLSHTKPSSEANRFNRQTDSSDDMSSDVVNKYFAFPAVRIHTDFVADSIARALDADALTIGKHIFFASGKFNLSTPEGIALLGHELTHVHQQLERGKSFSRREMDESQYQSLESQALANEERIYKFYNSPAMASASPQRNEMLQVYQNRVMESPSFVYGTSSPASEVPLHFSTIPQLKLASGSSGAVPPVFNEAVPGEEARGISETPSQEANIKEIAERVYSLLKKKLTIERERRGR